MALTSILPSSSVGAFFALQQSDYIEAIVLTADTAAVIQAPAGARFVLFSSDVDFFCKISADFTTATPIVPSTTTDGSAPELNPTTRELNSERPYVGVISATMGTITLAFYKAGG